MDPFPASWNLVKRNLPALAGYTAGAIVEAFRAGRRAKSAIDSDSSRPVTWQGEVPMKRPAPARRVAGRRVARRRTYRRVPRPFSAYTVVKRTVYNPSGIVFAPTASYGTSYKCFSFTLAQLPSSTDFTNFYQQYRIRKIELKFFLRGSTNNANGTATTATSQSVPVLLLANDNAKTTDPTSIGNVTAYQNCRVLQLTPERPVYHTLYPQSINTVQGSNVAPATEWLFTSDATIPHYGVQAAWLNSINTMAIEAFATYTIELKGRA